MTGELLVILGFVLYAGLLAAGRWWMQDEAARPPSQQSLPARSVIAAWDAIAVPLRHGAAAVARVQRRVFR
ncbi:hypothetical protein [Streptomonospora wellingtoniae]|uniref:Uncharacterized protein n=1 Tax=Streptomonospora wellingtoniae TaxID=3075544 RepID=A0ABU2KUZ1_9ACTN|nr:hypothetical protein [Streptomonospora sp. DSM 45055]MDT0302873.1 hypothetical protein [Streptomonospora sp. DSM 45055]